jgi:hypothetical protein
MKRWIASPVLALTNPTSRDILAVNPQYSSIQRTIGVIFVEHIFRQIAFYIRIFPTPPAGGIFTAFCAEGQLPQSMPYAVFIYAPLMAGVV